MDDDSSYWLTVDQLTVNTVILPLINTFPLPFQYKCLQNLNLSQL